MSYRINIAKRTLRRHWTAGMDQYTYVHYFRIDTELHPKDTWNQEQDNLTDLTNELRSVYPEPEFNITVYNIPAQPYKEVTI
mgnify:FL=1